MRDAPEVSLAHVRTQSSCDQKLVSFCLRKRCSPVSRSAPATASPKFTTGPMEQRECSTVVAEGNVDEHFGHTDTVAEPRTLLRSQAKLQT